MCISRRKTINVIKPTTIKIGSKLNHAKIFPTTSPVTCKEKETELTWHSKSIQGYSITKEIQGLHNVQDRRLHVIVALA